MASRGDDLSAPVSPAGKGKNEQSWKKGLLEDIATPLKFCL